MVTGRRIQNAREERFVKSLEDFSEQMERVYSQAERIEAD